MLANAASSLGLVHTVVFAYETIRKIQPKDLANLKKLANAFLEAGLSDQAIETGNAILAINPSDGDAEDMMKRASVAVAMNKGKWEGSTDFREQLKDQAETEALEQASKTVNDKKSLEDLIRKTYDLIQAEPQNLGHYRQLSDYYHRYGDHQNAIAWIKQARQLDAGKGDVSLEEKEHSLTLEYYDNIIEQWEKADATTPNNEVNQKGLEDAIQARKAYQRSQLESLVKRYPNEFGYRLILGYCSLKRKNTMPACLTSNLPKEMPSHDSVPSSTWAELTDSRNFSIWQSSSSLLSNQKYKSWTTVKKKQSMNLGAVTNRWGKKSKPSKNSKLFTLLIFPSGMLQKK